MTLILTGMIPTVLLKNNVSSLMYGVAVVVSWRDVATSKNVFFQSFRPTTLAMSVFHLIGKSMRQDIAIETKRYARPENTAD